MRRAYHPPSMKSKRTATKSLRNGGIAPRQRYICLFEMVFRTNEGCA